MVNGLQILDTSAYLIGLAANVMLIEAYVRFAQEEFADLVKWLTITVTLASLFFTAEFLAKYVPSVAEQAFIAQRFFFLLVVITGFQVVIHTWRFGRRFGFR